MNCCDTCKQCNITTAEEDCFCSLKCKDQFYRILIDKQNELLEKSRQEIEKIKDPQHREALKGLLKLVSGVIKESNDLHKSYFLNIKGEENENT